MCSINIYKLINITIFFTSLHLFDIVEYHSWGIKNLPNKKAQFNSTHRLIVINNILSIINTLLGNIY